MVKDTIRLTSMPLWQSLLLLALPSAYFFISIYLLMPLLGRLSVDPILNYSLTLTGPVVLLFTASLTAFKMEGNMFKWQVLRIRFRLKPMNKTDWKWAIGLTIVMIIGNAILLPTQEWVLRLTAFSPPDYLP